LCVILLTNQHLNKRRVLHNLLGGGNKHYNVQNRENGLRRLPNGKKTANNRMAWMTSAENESNGYVLDMSNETPW